MINSEVAWVLVCSGTQPQPQIILDSDYLLDYLSVSYDYVLIQKNLKNLMNLVSCQKQLDCHQHIANEHDKLYPSGSAPARIYGTPKMHKFFFSDSFPKLR